MHKSRETARLGATLAVALVSMLALIGVGMVYAQSAEPTPRPDACFAASDWGPAPDRLRPCVRIAHLYEDGSFRAAVSDADGTVRYTVGIGARDR